MKPKKISILCTFKGDFQVNNWVQKHKTYLVTQSICCVWGYSRHSVEDFMLQGHCRGFLADFSKEYINTYTANALYRKLEQKFSQQWECPASFPIYTFIYLWAIYILPGLVCQFSRSKTGGPILGIYTFVNRSQMCEYGNWEQGSAPFDFWEYINRIFFSVYRIYNTEGWKKLKLNLLPV